MAEIIKSEKPDKLLPAYKKDTDGTLHYYKYSVTETKIDGYTTTIETSKDGFTFGFLSTGILHCFRIPAARAS